MPGTYPRSSNPYFPFKNMKLIERELNRFHHLCASFSFQQWATSTVFSSLSSALKVVSDLNMMYPNLGGHFVVAGANETLIWCKKSSNGMISSEIVAWSAPVASSGFIIVFVPENEVLLTSDGYQNLFKFPPYLDRLKQIYIHYNVSDYNITNPNHNKTLGEVNPTEYKPVNKLPYSEKCIYCSELKSFCKCAI